MKIHQERKTITIEYSKGDFNSFFDEVSQSMNSFSSHNLVVDLSQNKAVTLNDLKLLLPFSKAHKKLKKSFVIVAKGINFNAVPTQLTVVPSVVEAHDIIEMEEIERDLGL